MATRGATKRLSKEYQQIQIDPPEFVIAKPSERNILEWHFVITDIPDSPYSNGQYYGTLTFPPDYPFKPPAIKMVTPSGRFQCNTRLCLSISDFHPKSWNPSWQVSTILTGLVSFMNSDEMTTGGISTPEQAKRGYARDSRGYNSTHQTFQREFPDLVELNKSYAEETNKAKKSGQVSATATTTKLEEVQKKGYSNWLTGAGVILVIVVLSRLMSD